MKALVIGSGGREHALAWKLAQSPRVTEVIVAPGNAGTAHEPRCRNAAVAATDVEGLLALAKAQGVGLTVVGPEAALAAGVVDAFRTAGLRIFGPTRAAAQLESSKSFTKDLLARAGVPTAGYAVFATLAPALDHVQRKGAPIVIKADGLAAGKGVTVAMTISEAQDALHALFAEAGAKVVIEDFLEGEEASYILLVDGLRYQPLASSQDHKRIFDGDQGPNTGGMGAYSPAPVVTKEVDARIRARVIEPVLQAMVDAGCPYQGFLYAGLMIDADGNPFVIEFNARLGDPETQPILMRLDSDFVELLENTLDGAPGKSPAQWSRDAAVGVVLASAGYPARSHQGDVIHGLAAAEATGAKVFHAGTVEKAGAIVTHGGRVLCVCARGTRIGAAIDSAYRAASCIHFDGMQLRRDIGHRARARES
ncbi:MAG: phosphoribosylamine--glycine ligase [Nevskiaceae bacterium]|nr:MAG: phosphoribosylamine--glycine ligase [Nevskiaceae bacterium]TBR72581.1 MAG: phosphoribosylamine--glycine ligase [Nevskiaceae bacterium]